MIKPNYQHSSIVNLMSSLNQGLGGPATGYAPLTLLPPATVANAAHVVLLVVDGLGYNYLLRRSTLLREYLQGSMTSVFPSSTAPAITTFLTGVAPQQHAVTGWFMALRELGTVAMILPFRPRWGGADFAVAQCGVEELLGAPSLFNRLAAQSYFVIHRSLVDSPYSRAGAGAAQRLGYRDLADCLGLIERIVKKPRRRDSQQNYIYAYWPRFDALSHQYGVGSHTVAEHFSDLEQTLARWLDTLAGTNTLVLLTADHGFVDTAARTNVRLSDHPHLTDCLTLPLCGEPRVAYAYVRPRRATQFEDYVQTQLAEYCELHTAENFIRAGWFGLGTPDPRLYDRIGDYVLLARDRCALKDTLPVESAWSDIGVHGGASEDEMRVPLVMAHC